IRDGHWSSDVCSSDLENPSISISSDKPLQQPHVPTTSAFDPLEIDANQDSAPVEDKNDNTEALEIYPNQDSAPVEDFPGKKEHRSEERRVGKENRHLT